MTTPVSSKTSLSIPFEGKQTVPVHLLRQYAFCARIPFFMEMMGVRPPAPMWVAQGQRYHQRQVKLTRERSAKRFGLQQPVFHYNVELRSDQFGLHGVCDLVLETEDAVYPVEIKMRAEKLRRGHLLQLAAYAMLAETAFAKSAPWGYFLYEKSGKTRRIILTSQIRSQVTRTTHALLRLFQAPHMPDSPASIPQCTQCEYLNFCNDRF